MTKIDICGRSGDNGDGINIGRGIVVVLPVKVGMV